MMNNFKFGIVSNAKAGYAKVFFAEDNFVTDWLPMLVRTSMKDKESWILNTNEHVCCIMDKHLHEGVILGAIHSDPEPPDDGAAQSKFRQVFEDGTVLEYDKAAHTLTANVQGDATVTANNINANAQNSATVKANEITAAAQLKATIQAANIELQGDVVIAGNLSAGSLILAPAGNADGKVHGNLQVEGDVTANGISLQTHIHGGVQTGGGSTAPPTS